jgi:hypothetical protein
MWSGRCNSSKLSHDGDFEKKAPESPPGQNYKAKSNLVLAFAETPADRGAILRHPVAAELEEIVYIVRVHLRPHKQVLRHIKAHARFQVYLKMIRAVDEVTR